MAALKDLPPDSGAIEPMILALRWVWGAGAIMALLMGLFLGSFKCPPLPKDTPEKEEGATSDSAEELSDKV